MGLTIKLDLSLDCTPVGERVVDRPLNVRLGLAIVPLCRGTARRPPSTNTGAPWPLRNFLTCALRRKILLSLWPLAYAPGRDDY